MDLNPDFLDMIAALGDENAEFLLVGAFALAVHGAPRATGDLDLWVRPEAGNAERVWRALLRFGAPIEAAGVSLGAPSCFLPPTSFILRRSPASAAPQGR